MKQVGILLLGLAILCYFPGNVTGEPIINPSQLSPNPTIINFEAISDFSNPLVIGDITFTSVTASLSLLNLQPPNWTVTSGEITGLALFPGGEPDSAIRITFATPVSEFLLGWGDPNFSRNFLRAYDADGQLLEEIEVPTGPIGGVFATWVGFKRSTADIAMLMVQPDQSYASGDDYVIDNIHYNVLPKPITITVDPYQDEYVIMVGSGIDGSSGTLFYIPINPDGTFGTPSEVGDLGYRSGAGIADFDNDGDLDFVAGARGDTSATAHFYLFENIGNGNFRKKWIASVPAGGLSDNKIGTFAVADYNGDGFNDFVAPIYRSNYIYLFTNNHDKTFAMSALPSLQDPFDAKEGDFNEDGYMDFVVTDYFNATVYLYEGNGIGGFSVRALFDVPGGDRAADITVGDFNEDGHLDIIVDDFLPGGGGHLYSGYIEDRVAKFLYEGKAYSRPVLGDYSAHGVDSFDFNNDGHRDLILSSYDTGTGSVYVMEGNGNGTFKTPERVASLSGSGFPVTPSQSLLLRVTIDIKPRSDPNSINPKSKGKIPVAILSTEEFDAPYDVNTESLTFGVTGEEASLAFCNPKGEDINGDRLKDLVCHFYTHETGFQCGDTEGILSGLTMDNVPIAGRDSVTINQCE